MQPMIRNLLAFLFHRLLQNPRSQSALLQVAILLSFGVITPAIAFAQVAERKNTSLAILTVLVPPGKIGNNYYVYVDRMIAARPPQKSVRQPGESESLFLDQTDTTNRFSNAGGVVLRSVNGEWDLDSKMRLSDRSWRSALGIFDSIDIVLPPGPHTVEILMLPPVNLKAERKISKRMPWLITRPVEVSVYPRQRPDGQSPEIVIPPPLDIDGLVEYVNRAKGHCVGVSRTQDGMPDMDGLKTRWDAYLKDPLVRAMLPVNKDRLMTSKGRMYINLPQELGGERELDEVQVPYLAQVILWRHGLPSSEAVEGCKQFAPQYAADFDTYNSIISAFRKGQRQFEELAALLK